MTYLAYNNETLKIEAHCETLAGAKRSATKANKRNAAREYPHAGTIVAGTREEYAAADVMVETYNMLNPSAGKIMIRKSQQGGCCDPATERYHTM
jgi:hypothetical protein